MNVINNCSNPKVKVFYKKNSEDHKNIIKDTEQLTDGILIQTGCNLNYLESGSTDFINFITNRSGIKTLTVKSHLPNIGYYDIAIDNDNNINSISKSVYFNNCKGNCLLDGVKMPNIFHELKPGLYIHTCIL